MIFSRRTLATIFSQENRTSIRSYVIGGTGVSLPHLIGQPPEYWLADMAMIVAAAKGLTVILGLFVMAVRAVHDSVRTWRYLRAKGATNG